MIPMTNKERAETDLALEDCEQDITKLRILVMNHDYNRASHLLDEIVAELSHITDRLHTRIIIP